MEEHIKKGRKSTADRRKRLRGALWGDVSEDRLWLRTQRVGFTTIPRTMPLIGQILDHLSGKGTPLFSTYLALWCRVYDEGIVEIRNQTELAIESGFRGRRAETTWRARMRQLEQLGFIKAKRGLVGDFQYVLLMNPLQRIKEIYRDKPEDQLYIGLVGRSNEIGADDLDEPQVPVGSVL